MRPQRLHTIRRLILRRELHTQQELQDALRAEGISVSQCTLSRDLELLRVEKVATPSGKKIYALPDDDRTLSPHGGITIGHTPGFLGLMETGETLLLTTAVGYAQRIALDIDNLHSPEVAGTVIGNSCVLVIGCKGISRENLIRAITPAVPELFR